MNIIFRIAICFACLSLTNIPPVDAQTKIAIDPIQENIDTLASRIREGYGLNIAYKKLPKRLSQDTIYTRVEENDYPGLLRYLTIFNEEISKYPKTYFKNSGLTSAFIVKRIFHKGKPGEGAYIYRKNIMIFDFERDQNNPKRQRHTIHHELYHMIELKTMGYPGWKDPEWAALNNEGFEYGQTKPQYMAQNKKCYSCPPYPGFITEYAMTSIEEDKAEIYACLMIESQNKLMHRWIKDDRILGEKVKYMKAFINNFCVGMDDVYWKNLFKSK